MNKLGPRTMRTHVEFRSSKFPAYEDEQYEVNPGCFGKRVAEFLAAGLTQDGFGIGDVIAEDWGWVVPVENPGFRLWIGCGNYDEYPDGDGFLCFIEPHTPFIRRLFRKIDTTERVGALRGAIDSILTSDPEISGIKWWTYDQFNNPVTQQADQADN